MIRQICIFIIICYTYPDLVRDYIYKGEFNLPKKRPQARGLFLFSKIPQEFLAFSPHHLSSDDLISTP